ncbi:MAG: glycosyltransferase N-terminal domain-containing protein, partial [Betaproteobacteria bacterium]
MLMETEVWPNMVAACAKRHLPLLLVNARLSERSLCGYRRWSSLTQPMFAALGGAAATARLTRSALQAPVQCFEIGFA